MRNINNQNGTVYKDTTFTDFLRLDTCTNIQFINCRFVGLADIAIRLIRCQNILIKFCYFENIRGAVNANLCKDIQVLNCLCVNINGIPGTKNNFIQFNNCSGSLCRIAGNYIKSPCPNEVASSNIEDIISMFSSHGDAFSTPIIIEDNVFLGGGQSQSGSCIMLGDNGGSNYLVRNNKMYYPGRIGIGIASGSYMVVQNNEIVGGGLFSGESSQGWAIVCWNEQSPITSLTNHITIENNSISWINSRSIWISNDKTKMDLSTIINSNN